MVLSSETKELFRKLYDEGFSLRKISRRGEVSPNTVKKYLLEQGVKVTTQNRVYCLRKNDELLIGLYCGLWAGDGTQFYDQGYTVKICLHSGNRELILFVQKIILDLFGKKSRFVHDHGQYSGFIIFKSKFIYDFISHHLHFGAYKTKTVQLKYDINSYSKRFLEGFLLGLMLSDGHLKHKLVYQTISLSLAHNLIEILKFLSFHPYMSTANRKKYGWNNLHCVYLSTKESQEASKLLDTLLKRVNHTTSFRILKGV